MKYIKSRESYTSTTLSGRNVSYSVSRYGKYAKELALKAEESLDKPLCLIEELEDKAIIKLFSATHGYHDVYIDLEDVELCKNYVWSIMPKGNGYYVCSNTKQYIHRLILGVTDKNIIIDHIDRNPKNNMKENLRITNHSGNKRNLPIKSNNTSGIPGIRYDEKRNRWCMEIRDENGKKVRKNFGCKKYGEQKAKQLAIDARLYYERQFGYINNESSTTRENTSIGEKP